MTFAYFRGDAVLPGLDVGKERENMKKVWIILIAVIAAAALSGGLLWYLHGASPSVEALEKRYDALSETLKKPSSDPEERRKTASRELADIFGEIAKGDPAMTEDYAALLRKITSGTVSFADADVFAVAEEYRQFLLQSQGEKAALEDGITDLSAEYLPAEKAYRVRIAYRALRTCKTEPRDDGTVCVQIPGELLAPLKGVFSVEKPLTLVPDAEAGALTVTVSYPSDHGVLLTFRGAGALSAEPSAPDLTAHPSGTVELLLRTE